MAAGFDWLAQAGVQNVEAQAAHKRQLQDEQRQSKEAALQSQLNSGAITAGQYGQGLNDLYAHEPAESRRRRTRSLPQNQAPAGTSRRSRRERRAQNSLPAKQPQPKRKPRSKVFNPRGKHFSGWPKTCRQISVHNWKPCLASRRGPHSKSMSPPMARSGSGSTPTLRQ